MKANVKNEEGIALISVLIIMCVLGILASTILSLSYLGYRAKHINAQSQSNFYSCEGALNEINVGLKNKALAGDINSVKSYLGIAPAGDTFSCVALTQLISGANTGAGPQVRTDGTHRFIVTDAADGDYYGKAVCTATTITLKDVSINCQDIDKGYSDTIITDMVLNFDGTASTNMGIWDFSIISDGAVDVGTQGGADILGNIYISYPASAGYALKIGSQSYMNILAEKSIIYGNIYVSSSGFLNIIGEQFTVVGDIILAPSSALFCSASLSVSGQIYSENASGTRTPLKNADGTIKSTTLATILPADINVGTVNSDKISALQSLGRIRSNGEIIPAMLREDTPCYSANLGDGDTNNYYIGIPCYNTHATATVKNTVTGRTVGGYFGGAGMDFNGNDVSNKIVINVFGNSKMQSGSNLNSTFISSKPLTIYNASVVRLTKMNQSDYEVATAVSLDGFMGKDAQKYYYYEEVTGELTTGTDYYVSDTDSKGRTVYRFVQDTSDDTLTYYKRILAGSGDGDFSGYYKDVWDDDLVIGDFIDEEANNVLSDVFSKLSNAVASKGCTITYADWSRE